MSELYLDNYIIDAPIVDILEYCKSQLTNGKLSNIIDNGDWVSIPCPFHSNGRESHNSCGVVSDPNSELQYGLFNCFACGTKGTLVDLIAGCFECDKIKAKEWLIYHFGTLSYERTIDIPEIDLNSNLPTTTRDISELDTMENYHPYMTKRKLTPEVIDKFKIKYNPLNESIVFPVWDKNGNYLFYTSRNINYKSFHIPKNVTKPVYLLNFIIEQGIKCCVVCESQINAITCWTHGVPAIALFGCHLLDNQLEDLNSSGIRYYVLALDNDEKGNAGVVEFKKKIRKDVFVDVITVPEGKDVNDLTPEEFNMLFEDYVPNKTKI